MSRSRSVLVLLLFAALVVLTGCSSSGPEKAGKEPAGAPTAAPSAWNLTATIAAPVKLGARIESPVLKDHRLFYAFTDEAGGTPDKIASTDLTTGKRTVLLTTRSLQHGIITGIALTGWIVYVEESPRGDSDPGTASWVVAALDPSTGQRTVLMEGGPSVETPDVYGGREATWVVYPNEGGVATAKAYSWKPGQGETRAADAMPGDADECTPPSQDQQLVAACTSNADWWAWTEKDPDSGMDDPSFLLVSSRNGGEQTRVADLETWSDVVLLPHFLLWQHAPTLKVTSLDHLGATADLVGGYLVGSTDGRTAATITEGTSTANARLVTEEDLRLTSE